ncbi:MAG: hypothetical protein JO020_12365 [Chloroflexi bacterium]|nr:hypothetical protein [Chloroflexota bacterium]
MQALAGMFPDRRPSRVLEDRLNLVAHGIPVSYEVLTADTVLEREQAQTKVAQSRADIAEPSSKLARGPR